MSADIDQIASILTRISTEPGVRGNRGRMGEPDVVGG